jgi:pimeloyl-ACP methyl ester carboxylesterase
MSCCSSSAVPIPVFSCKRDCLSITTSHGLTYCEVYRSRRDDHNGKESIPIVMVHGLGGSSRHWANSDIPALLAESGFTVVTFDLYSHGKSDTHKMSHTLDVFLTQLNDIIHHDELPVAKSKIFYLQGFSFGAFIVLNYLSKFHHNGCTCCSGGHTIPRVVFQSPWHGQIPMLVKGLIYIPGFLRLCKPSDMDAIRSIEGLKQILLSIDKDNKFKDRMKDFGDIVKSVDSVDANLTCENVLFFAGTREPFFYWTAKSLFNTAKASAVSENKLRRYTYRLCKSADHMTFVHQYDGYVGDYYRQTLREFYMGENNDVTISL